MLEGSLYVLSPSVASNSAIPKPFRPSRSSIGCDRARHGTPSRALTAAAPIRDGGRGAAYAAGDFSRRRIATIPAVSTSSPSVIMPHSERVGTASGAGAYV